MPALRAGYNHPLGVFAMFSLPHCFVISIQNGEGARRFSAVRQLNHLGVGFTFIPGYAPDDPEVDAGYSVALNRASMKRPLSRGEIAAYLSHRRALAAFLETDAEFAIILEDDFGAVDPERFAEQVLQLAQAPVQWDLVKLFDYGKRKSAHARLVLNSIELVEYRSPTAGMVAYLVRRSGARKLTARRFVFRPIDEDIKFYWEIDLYVFSAFPNLVSEISDTLGGSQIEPERALLRSNRSVYRSIRGFFIEFRRLLIHRWSRRRYGLKSAMRNYDRDSARRQSAGKLNVPN